MSEFFLPIQRPEWQVIERTYDYVIVSRCLHGKIKTIKVVEDFESRPRKAFIFLVERAMEIQEVRESKMPEASPRFSGGTLPGRRNKGGKEVEKEG